MDASQPQDAGHTASDPAQPDPAEKFSATHRRGERGPDETIWQGGYSAVDQSGSFIILGLITIGLIAASIFFPPMIIISLIAIPVLWIIQGIRVWWIKLGVAYELTNRRFIHESGVINRTTDRIEVIDVDDVTIEQGIMDRMFNVGTIKITSSDRTHPELRLHGIKDVRKVALMIDDARQAERDRRGVYIESV
ncbi:PH domain-containing protein [Bremerella cremea]|uniref:PH domain-containing protein n=1 Tax=Bremerella cremea TaxID=1031537 RepID=A0A368KQP4_9BACT|nr:PH domain-containing protein [Bremerella cremea]RCS44752.1 PH domain-containing protein [Bremerella cremea]